MYNTLEYNDLNLPIHIIIDQCHSKHFNDRKKFVTHTTIEFYNLGFAIPIGIFKIFCAKAKMF